MRNIAACYSDQAVKVADSYCSTYPNTRSYVSPKPTSHLPLPLPQPQTQTAVTYTYRAKLTPTHHIHITITWSLKLTHRNRGFSIRFSDKSKPTRQLSHRITTEKGSDTFNSSGSKIDLHWDLSSAKYNYSNPVPIEEFFLSVSIDSQLCLLLGDIGERNPTIQTLLTSTETDNDSETTTTAPATLISQCEQIVSGLPELTTRAQFSNSGPTHDLLIKYDSVTDSNNDPSLSIMIDGRSVVTVKRLRWNFRGNQVVFIDGLLIDVMWDVQRFVAEEFQFQGVGRLSLSLSGSSSSSGRSSLPGGGVGCDGVFLFRTRSGLDSRLWLEEERLVEKNHDKVEFSFIVCASRSS